MIQLVRRYQGGGAGWIGVINNVASVGQSIGNYFTEKAKAEKEKKIAIANKNQALAEQQTAEWRAKAAQAAGQFDRNGGGSVTMAINNGLRTNPNVTYDNGATTPGYTPASQPTGNMASSIGSLIGSFFKKKEATTDTEAPSVQAQGEQQEVLSGTIQTPPVGAPEKDKNLKEVEEQKKKAAALQGTLTANNNAVVSKDGCKLKKRFNPRQFKKQK